MIIWGIDPGQKGGLARLHGNGVTVYDMVEIQIIGDMISIDQDADTTHVWLEKAQCMPKQGITSAFNYGAHYGELRGLLKAMRTPFTEVRPQTWTKVIHAGTAGGTPKARTLEAVKKLFPKAHIVPPGCRVPHMGIVDALAIAEHGRRILRA